MITVAEHKQDYTSSRCHCINIRRASNSITGFYDDLLAPYHLTLNQFSLLSNIQRIQPCNVRELSDVVRLERTTLVRNLKPLIEVGLVEDLAPTGNRNRKLVVSDAGVQRFKEAFSAWEQAQQDVQAYLGEDDLNHLMTTLLKLEKMTWRPDA